MLMVGQLGKFTNNLNYTLKNEWILWHVNYNSMKLFLKSMKC